jgi:hypothetical protein
MDLTVNQWLGEFDPHTRSQNKGNDMREGDGYAIDLNPIAI